MAFFKWQKPAHASPGIEIAGAVNEQPSLDELRARLQTVQEELGVCESQVAVLFDSKTRGVLDDGSYNIEVSAIGMKQSRLEAEQKRLLELIGGATGELARTALRRLQDIKNNAA